MAISTDSPGKHHVFLHDGHPLGVDGTQVSVLEETHNVGFCSFLEGNEGLGLESEVLV